MHDKPRLRATSTLIKVRSSNRNFTQLFLILILFYTRAFLPHSRFFCDKKKLENNIFFQPESNFITNNSEKFQVANVKKNFPILRFRKTTFQNLSIFGQYLI